MAIQASSHPKGFCFTLRSCTELSLGTPASERRTFLEAQSMSGHLPPFNRSLRSGSSLGLMAMRWSGPVSV